MKKYSMKIIKLSKYASSLASNTRDEMSHFVMGMSEEIKAEHRADMIHDNMDLSSLKFHTHQVKDTSLRKSNRDAKREKSFESCSSKSSLSRQTYVK